MKQEKGALRLWKGFIFVLFFVSGFSALVYEVLWTRILTITFGHTIYAVSTVLTAFMAGLALGSFIAGKYADRWKKLVRIYALLEGGIGLYALVALGLFLHLNVLYAPFYNSLGSSFFLLTVVRFILAFFLLILPTTLMGATVPILVKAVTESLEVLGKRAGLLYAINTVGAVAGTLVCGFYLIPTWGLKHTNFLAVGLNMFILFAAYFLPFQADEEKVSEEAIPEISREQRWAYWVAGLGGFIALALEVVWTRSLVFSLYLGSTTYAVSTMLGAFLFGIAFGSYLFGFLADRSKNRPLMVFIFELVLGIASLAGILAIISGRIEAGFSPEFSHGAFKDFIKAFLLMLPSTLMMGALFPFLIRHAARKEEHLGREVSRVYSANTVGAIFGSFTAGFIIIPLIGLTRTVIVFSLLAFWLGFFFWRTHSEKKRAQTAIALIHLGVSLGSFLVIPRFSFKSYFEKMGQKVCYYKEGPAATITITEDKGHFKRLYVDATYVQGSNHPIASIDYKMQAQLPSLLHPNPKHACTIGFGTGGTSYSFTRFPSYETITCVEIDMNVPRGADCFPESNHGLLHHPDPRYHIHNDDARAYLENTQKTFDVITIDLSDIAYKSSSDVYTKEFIDTCKKRLNPGGFNVIWTSVKSLSIPNVKILLRTFFSVYPKENISLWHMTSYPNHDIMIVAVKDRPLRINWNTLAQRMAIPAVKKDLQEINLQDPYKLLTCYYLSGEAVVDYLGEGELHTVDKPVLEFQAPKDRFRQEAMWQNITNFYWQIRDPYPPVDVKDKESFQEIYDKYLEARDYYFKGEIEVLKSKNLMSGAPFFYRAYELMKKDRSLLYCLGGTKEQMQKYLQRIEKNSRDLEAYALLGFGYYYRGELPQGREYLKRLKAQDPNYPLYSYLMGLYLEEEGKMEEAVEHYLAFLPVATPTYKRLVEARLRAIELLQKKNRTLEDEKAIVTSWITAGKLSQAFERAQALMAQKGGSRELTLWYGQVLQQGGALRKARKIFQSLVERNPRDGEAWYYLGDTLLQLRLVKESEEAFKKALALDRLNPNIYYNLARVKELEDKKEEAEEFMGQALSLGGEGYQRIFQQDPIFVSRFTQ